MTDTLPDIQQNNQDILFNIQSLQTIEQDLFTSLETNKNLTPEEQQKIIDKINGVSKMRINLYKTLSGVNVFFQDALSNTRGTLQEQTSAIGIIESELNQAKRRLKQMEEEKNNKIRLIEINDYYGQRYEEHSQLMKIIVLTLIPVIALAALNKYYVLPDKVFKILMSLVFIVGLFFVARRWISIINRDSMNYQEYDWYFNKKTAPVESSVASSNPWINTNLDIGSCIGQRCCSDGQTYDATVDKCVTDAASTNSDALNDVLTKGTSAFQKPDVTLSAGIEPYTSGFGMFKGFGV
jgi:hypothetical protein